MYLHIAEDQKFIDQAIEQFEAVAPNRNTYLIVVPNQSYQLKYIKKRHDVVLTTVSSKQYQSVISELNKYELVFLHNLFEPYKRRLVLKSKNYRKFILLFWGAEGYDKLLAFHNSLYLPKTKKEIYHKLEFRNSLPSKVWFILNDSLKLLFKRLKFKLSQERSLNKLAYIGIFAKEDYDYIDGHFSLKANWFWFCYFTLETLGVYGDKMRPSNKKNILVGNSAQFTNNHLDIFELLIPSFRSLGFKSKIICPLSYGNKSYASYISSYGKEKFGESFVALQDFMPISEYNNIISSCSVAIMGHLRQQAVGNLISLIWFGTKVFLFEENPLYKFFLSNNITVFSINEEIMLKKELDLERLDEKIVLKNRAALESVFSKKIVYNKLREFLDTVHKGS